MPDTPLNPDALEAAYVAVSDESWLSARAARAVASAAVSAYLAVARPELQANSKPNQNFEVVNSLEILEAHDGYGFEVKGNIMHQGCMCGADCGRVTRTPDNVHRAHVAEVLDKHMQEREAQAWDRGHARALAGIIPTGNEPEPRNPYRKEPRNGR